MYDNKTLVVENFNDHPVDISIQMNEKQTVITDLITGKTLQAAPRPKADANNRWMRNQPKESSFRMTLLPHSYRGFSY